MADLFLARSGVVLSRSTKKHQCSCSSCTFSSNLLRLLPFTQHEALQVELETGVNVDDSNREIDIMFSGQWSGGEHKIAIEMKCYRTLAASGGNRGATDIFMKDVYFDLFLLERYVALGIASEGVSLGHK